ncbi:hypothetical protein ACOSP7_008632 [Xanthoceras sorbifolium]
MSSRGDESPPSTSGRGYDDPIDLSYDSWGESEAASAEVTVASYDTVTVSFTGTSRVADDIPMGIPLVELPGDAAGPCPMGPSRPLGLLLNNPASVLTEDDIMRLRFSYGIPDGVALRAPYKEERPDWDVPGWTCLYEFPFQRVGFRLPIVGLPRKVLDHFELAPGQLMPNSWRILLALDLLCTREGIVFELPDLFYSYTVREHDTEKGRYNLNLRPNRTHLITELTTNDRLWKDRYFFARGLLVDWPLGDTVVRATWSKAVNTGAHQAVVGLTCVKRTEKVLSYDVKERSWRSILAEENLRPSHLWKFSVINEPVDIMAGEIAAPAADDAMRRLREKRKGKKKAESSDQAASTPPPPPSSRAKASQDASSAGKKRRREDSTSAVDASVDLVFPQDASAYSDVGSILPLVERLLLPEDKSRLREMGLSQAADWGLGHLFQALQSHVHLKEELGVALKKVRDLKASNVEAKKTALEASSRAVEATLELNRLKSSVDKLEAKLKAKEADYNSLYDKAEDNVLNAVIKTRADLMREYRDGRATEWKVDSWIADHEELSRYDEDEADDKPGEEPVPPPPEGSTVVALVAQPTGESRSMTLSAGHVTVWRWRVHDLECGSRSMTLSAGHVTVWRWRVHDLECGSCDRVKMASP